MANSVTIHTERLTLVLQTPDEVLASVEAMDPADRAQVSPLWLARVRELTNPDPWSLSFAMVHQASGAVIGGCSYKGPPDADAVVEIAYGVDPAHRDQGYATEAARGLVKYAFGSGEVRRVRAHTLPNPNASTHVLTKCGFEKIGEVIDPEDGLVWRWEVLPNPPAMSASSA
jgi:[ribosomal protein S5]-alanine N-acetyltransferase